VHQYAGNPASFPVSISLVDDADLNPPTAANVDLSGQGNADRTAWLRANTGGAAAENWLPRTLIAGIGWYASLWNPASGQWMVATMNTATFVAGIITGSGIDNPATDWNEIGGVVLTVGATRTPASIAADADQHHFYMSVMDSGSNGFQHYVVDVTGGPPVWSSIEFSNVGFTDDQLIVFGGYLTAAIGSSVAGGCQLRVAATPVPVATPMTQILVSAIAGAPAAPAVTTWIAKSNGSYVLLAPGGLQATPFMLKSTPAANLTLNASWTAELALSSVVNGATDIITGLDWGSDSTGPCWLATVRRSGTSTRIIKSADGINWTLVATLTGSGSVFVSLCFAAGNWHALQNNLITNTCFSLDGGVTWFATQATMNASFGPRFGLAGSPTQACCWTTGQLRFSQNAALPATQLT
jgi:hypothetical protein